MRASSRQELLELRFRVGGMHLSEFAGRRPWQWDGDCR